MSVENRDEQISNDDRLIIRYLTGEAEPEEAIAMHSWLEVPENRIYFKKFESAWNAASPSKVREPDSLQAWASIQRKEHAESQKGSAFNSGKTWTLRIAASVLLVAASVAAIFFVKKDKSESLKHLVTARNDKTEEIMLRDSSTVILNKNASISYPDVFENNLREVELVNGEAFFSIADNKSKPFIVHTTLADIKVVGTEFNVISAGNELIVSVLQGRVIVIAGNESDTLTVGEAARIQPGFKGVRKDKVGNPNDLAYATHTLVFNDVPLGEVFRSIEKSYPYVVDVLNKDIENCKLTGTFEGATADKILAIIAQTLNLTVTKNDNHFTIEGKGCP